jgi:hypothetical protein
MYLSANPAGFVNTARRTLPNTVYTKSSLKGFKIIQQACNELENQEHGNTLHKWLYFGLEHTSLSSHFSFPALVRSTINRDCRTTQATASDLELKHQSKLLKALTVVATQASKDASSLCLPAEVITLGKYSPIEFARFTKACEGVKELSIESFPGLKTDEINFFLQSNLLQFCIASPGSQPYSVEFLAKAVSHILDHTHYPGEYFVASQSFEYSLMRIQKIREEKPFLGESFRDIPQSTIDGNIRTLKEAIDDLNGQKNF